MGEIEINQGVKLTVKKVTETTTRTSLNSNDQIFGSDSGGNGIHISYSDFSAPFTAGVKNAVPSTNPSSDPNVQTWKAVEAGTYTNFGGIVVSSGDITGANTTYLVWDGDSWIKDVKTIDIAVVNDLSTQKTDEAVSAKQAVLLGNSLRESKLLEFESGGLSTSTGNPVASTARARIITPYDVIEGDTYHVSINSEDMRVFGYWYYLNNTWVSYTATSSNSFTVPAGVNNVKVVLSKLDGSSTVSGGDIAALEVYIYKSDLSMVTPEKITTIESLSTLSDYYVIENYDRPDLPDTLIITDSEGKVINTDSTEEQTYYSPERTGFDLAGPEVYYENIYAGYDALVERNGTDNYMAMSVIATSSYENREIRKYTFTPASPSKRVLIVSGMHGSERTFFLPLLRFFQDLVLNYWNDPVLEYIRNNVQIDLIPIASPSSTLRQGAIDGKGSGRKVFETAPFPVSWVKVGSSLTISFDVGDFPDTGGRLTASTYFSNPNIVNKLRVSVFNSNNGTLVPNAGYLITSVTSGTEIVCDTATPGDGSGTAMMYVVVDPNRNFDPGGTVWADFTPVSSTAQFPNEYAPAPHDNKGTKPFSLAETIAIKNLIDSNSYDFYLDMHSGSGNNYLDWYDTVAGTDALSIVNDIRDEMEKFSKDSFAITNRTSTITTQAPVYFKVIQDKVATLIEWSNILITTDRNATLAERWMALVFTKFLNL